MTDPEVYDVQGTRRDMAWVTSVYGSVLTRAQAQAGERVYRIVKIIEREGPSVLLVNTENADGSILQNIVVARYWPDAPNQLPFPPASAWFPNAIVGQTNDRGEVGFALGRGDYISAPGQGVSAVWVADPAIKSDLASKLGMIAGTNHRRLDFVFRPLAEGGSNPPPPPTPDPSIEARLAALEGRVGAIEALLQGNPDLADLAAQINRVETSLRQMRDALGGLG